MVFNTKSTAKDRVIKSPINVWSTLQDKQHFIFEEDGGKMQMNEPEGQKIGTRMCGRRQNINF